MSTRPGTPEALGARVGELVEQAWAVAALSAALDRGLVSHIGDGADAATVAQRSGMPPALTERLLDVLIALGFAARADGGYELTPDARALLADPARAERVAADLRGGLMLAGDFAARARKEGDELSGWHHSDPAILRAQGLSSSGAVPALAQFAIPSLGDLAERLARPGAAMLDVGTGVAAIAIGFCRRFPQLRAVGLEPATAPMAEARRNVVAAGLHDRIELRAQRVEELQDEDAFDFAFLPNVFLSTPTLQSGLAAIHRALRPGGWVIMASLGAAGDELRPALARLRATIWGSEALSPDALAGLCREAGYDDVRVLPGPPSGALVPVAARRGV